MRRAVLALLTMVSLALPMSAQPAAPVQIRRIDQANLTLVRVTAVVPEGSRPTLWEGKQRAPFVKTRALGSAQAMLLAVDNSPSMTGRPLREAKRAA